MGVPDDPASATLAAIRAIEQAATEGPWRAVAGLWATDGGKQEIFPAVISSRGDPAKAETWLMAAGRGSPNPEANAEFAAAARTAMPRLLAAVEAAAAFHQPGPFALLGALCPEHEACRNFSITSSEADRVAACPKCSATVQRTCSHGAHAIWPCAEYRAISGELLSKEGSDGRD